MSVQFEGMRRVIARRLDMAERWSTAAACG